MYFPFPWLPRSPLGGLCFLPALKNISNICSNERWGVSVLLRKEAVPFGRGRGDDDCASESSLLCSRRCAGPLAGLRFPRLFCTPLRDAVRYAGLGQWEKHCPEVLSPACTLLSTACVSIGSRRERNPSHQTEPISPGSSHNPNSTCFFPLVFPERREECHVCWGLGRVTFSVALCVTLAPLYFISTSVNKSNRIFWCLNSCQCTGGYTAIAKCSGTSVREVCTTTIQWAIFSHCKYLPKEGPLPDFRLRNVVWSAELTEPEQFTNASQQSDLALKKETQPIPTRSLELCKQCPTFWGSWVWFSFLTLHHLCLAWRLSQIFQVFPNFKWKIPLNSAGNKAAGGSCPNLKEPRKQAWVTSSLKTTKRGKKWQSFQNLLGAPQSQSCTARLCFPRNACGCQQLGQQLAVIAAEVCTRIAHKDTAAAGAVPAGFVIGLLMCVRGRGWNPRWLKGKITHCSSTWTAMGRGKYQC